MDKETEQVLEHIRSGQVTTARVFIRGQRLVIELINHSAQVYAPLSALVADVAPGQ